METAFGQGVAPTRILYGDPATNLARVRPPRPHRFQTGTRDNLRAFTLGPSEVAGKFACDVSAEELLEMLAITVKGAVAPTTPSGAVRLWTYTPGTSLDSMTAEWHDGANVWQGVGLRGDKLQIQGSANGPNTASVDLVGVELSRQPSGLTAGLTDRTPSFIEGWETKLYLDAFGGTPGTTYIDAALINWNVQYMNALARKYFAVNRNVCAQVNPSALDATVDLTIEAATAQALTEFDNWEGVTKRLMRLEFGQNEVILAGTNEGQTITTTGTPASGTFTLTVKRDANDPGQTTAPIIYNASAAVIQAALQALSNVGVNDVVCTGGPLPTGVVVTFQGTLASLDIPAMTFAILTLTPGTPVITTSTPGVAGYRRFFTIDMPMAWSKYDITPNDSDTRVYALSGQYVYDTVNAYGIQYRAQNLRTANWA